MLLIMLIMIGHDAFPHVHPHDHVEHDHCHIVSDDHEKSVLGRLFEDHARSNHSHKYTRSNETITLVKREITSLFLLHDAGIINFPYRDTSSVRCVLFRQPEFNEPYLHSNGLRAPPLFSLL